MTQKIAIVGSGPTGLFTALLLNEFNGEIHIFEKNSDIGEKLKLTGGGRMNVMNKNFSKDHFFSQSSIRKKDHFFKNPLTKPLHVSQLFDKIGVEYVWEKNRAILKSQNAKAEVERLKEKILAQKNCILQLNTEIFKISPLNNTEEKNKEMPSSQFILQTKNKEYSETKFDSIVISTGGMFQVKEQCNREKTYKIPHLLGHTVAKLSPSLSPLRQKKEVHLLSNASGVALPVKLYSGKFLSKKNRYEKEISDDLLVTHFGFSGPAVLDFSALWDGKEDVFINFLPRMSQKVFLSIFTAGKKGKTSLHKFLHTYFSKKFIETLLNAGNFSPSLQALLRGREAIHLSDISKKDEQEIIRLIFRYQIISPEKFPYQGCWTTKGGIHLKDINISTLESNLQKNIYFGGEIIDIDGLCGGYNLSFAMICAGIISKNIKKNQKSI